MKTISLLVLCVLVCVGCSTHQDVDGHRPSPLSDTKSTRAVESLPALSEIEIGMTVKELVAMLDPKSLDSGTVYWGGTGARRLYFQMKAGQQIWFEISGPAEGARVTQIGPTEPKTEWIRHEGDSITVR